MENRKFEQPISLDQLVKGLKDAKEFIFAGSNPINDDFHFWLSHSGTDHKKSVEEFGQEFMKVLGKDQEEAKTNYNAFLQSLRTNTTKAYLKKNPKISAFLQENFKKLSKVINDWKIRKNSYAEFGKTVESKATKMREAWEENWNRKLASLITYIQKNPKENVAIFDIFEKIFAPYQVKDMNGAIKEYTNDPRVARIKKIVSMLKVFFSNKKNLNTSKVNKFLKNLKSEVEPKNATTKSLQSFLEVNIDFLIAEIDKKLNKEDIFNLTPVFEQKQMKNKVVLQAEDRKEEATKEEFENKTPSKSSEPFLTAEQRKKLKEFQSTVKVSAVNATLDLQQQHNMVETPKFEEQKEEATKKEPEEKIPSNSQQFLTKEEIRELKELKPTLNVAAATAALQEQQTVETPKLDERKEEAIKGEPEKKILTNFQQSFTAEEIKKFQKFKTAMQVAAAKSALDFQQQPTVEPPKLDDRKKEVQKEIPKSSQTLTEEEIEKLKNVRHHIQLNAAKAAQKQQSPETHSEKQKQSAPPNFHSSTLTLDEFFKIRPTKKSPDLKTSNPYQSPEYLEENRDLNLILSSSVSSVWKRGPDKLQVDYIFEQMNFLRQKFFEIQPKNTNGSYSTDQLKFIDILKNKYQDALKNLDRVVENNKDDIKKLRELHFRLNFDTPKVAAGSLLIDFQRGEFEGDETTTRKNVNKLLKKIEDKIKKLEKANKNSAPKEANKTDAAPNKPPSPKK